ncbi:hypothetical protein DFH07DRAFT_862016 [Mycena maculata]|uniref:Mini-chromosome maintenance complex-binding protein n=1 Tax=Mycena maculata TaxID=230809 RepID=A0AAD7MGM6_9AGAR|nr:hypothetical protein DFH07DRAFT_862016 [Mycena maculata]
MVSSTLVDALYYPTHALEEIYIESDRFAFPALVSSHFSAIFASHEAFSEIPAIESIDPRSATTAAERRLVYFRAMVQDTSPAPEMYLTRRSGGRCGGWGLADDDEGDVNYTDLAECTVVWAVSLPGESPWVAQELDGDANKERVEMPESHPHKYPVPSTPHLGVQVKVYDMSMELRATDAVTFVGIYSMEPLTASLDLPTLLLVPTLHVLFARPLPLTLVPRVFPVPDAKEELRAELIAWLADTALASDLHAAEWVVLAIISRVHSRTPPLLPLSLTLSRFPSPAIEPSEPRLALALSRLLPLLTYLPLSLDALNNTSFAPASKPTPSPFNSTSEQWEGGAADELHSGRLQLPRGSVLLISAHGMREGKVNERGLANLRALQEVLTSQSLDYVFPFSRFAFETDVVGLVTAEGEGGALVQTSTTVPLVPSTSSNAASDIEDRIGALSLSDPASANKLYAASGEEMQLPPPAKFAAFRALLGGAKAGGVKIGEGVGEHIQSSFVAERKQDNSVTAEDLMHRIAVARLMTLSLHQSEVTVEVWERVRELEEVRRARVAAGKN